MDAGIMFPYIAAVSAGAANVLSYISGQKGRNRLVAEKLVSTREYQSMSNLIRKGSYFDFDYIFKTVPRELLFFDQLRFDSVPVRLRIGAQDINQGLSHWFEKNELYTDYNPAIASCSIPVISKIARFAGLELLDGGISDPIPIERSIADGNQFHVVVLTRNAGYIKAPVRPNPVIWTLYRRYPRLLWAMRERANTYNRQLQLAEKLEAQGRALIIRPQQELKVSRLEKSPAKLLPLYDQGHVEGAQAMAKLRQIFRF
jgi:predicted patatin/cPLA2 family phospholipase